MPSPAIISQRGTGGHFTGIVTALLRSAVPDTPDPGGSAREVHESSSPFDLKRWLIEITNNTDVTGTVTVSGATFEFTSLDGSDGTRSFDLRQVLAAVVMADATWNERDATTAWTTPGAAGTPAEVASAVVATASFTMLTGADDTDVFTGAGLDALLTTFLNAGAGAKLLLLMSRNPLAANDGNWNEFAGPAYVALGPMLTIPYTAGGPTGPTAARSRIFGPRGFLPGIRS